MVEDGLKKGSSYEGSVLVITQLAQINLQPNSPQSCIKGFVTWMQAAPLQMVGGCRQYYHVYKM